MLALWIAVCGGCLVAAAGVRQAMSQRSARSVAAESYPEPPRWVDAPATRTLLGMAGANARVAYGTGEQTVYAVAGGLLLIPFAAASFGGYEMFSLMLSGEHREIRAIVAGVAVGVIVVLIDRSLLQPNRHLPWGLAAARVAQAVVLGALFGLLIATRFFAGSIERYERSEVRAAAEAVLSESYQVPPSGHLEGIEVRLDGIAPLLAQTQAQEQTLRGDLDTANTNVDTARQAAVFVSASLGQAVRTERYVTSTGRVRYREVLDLEEQQRRYDEAAAASPAVAGAQQIANDTLARLDDVVARVQYLAGINTSAVAKAVTQRDASNDPNDQSAIQGYDPADHLHTMIWAHELNTEPSGAAIEATGTPVTERTRVVALEMLVLFGLSVLVVDLTPLLYKFVFLRGREHDRRILDCADAMPALSAEEADDQSARLIANVQLEGVRMKAQMERETQETDAILHHRHELLRRREDRPVSDHGEQEPHSETRNASVDDEQEVRQADPDQTAGGGDESRRGETRIRQRLFAGRPVFYEQDPIIATELSGIHMAKLERLPDEPTWMGRSVVAKLPFSTPDAQRMHSSELAFYSRHGQLIDAVPEHKVFRTGGLDDVTDALLLMRFYPRTSLDKFVYEDDQRVWKLDIPVWAVMAWLLDIADLVGAMWDRGLVHADGKPNNLLVNGEEGDPDFGFASFHHERDVAGTLRLCDFSTADSEGKYPIILPTAFSPPEDGPLHAFGDVYSFLGATGYWLLTGEPPPPPGSDVAGHAMTQNEVLAQVPELVDLVARWLDPDPTRRVPGANTSSLESLIKAQLEETWELLNNHSVVDILLHRKGRP